MSLLEGSLHSLITLIVSLYINVYARARTHARSLRRCLYANEGLWEVKKGFKALLVVQFRAA